MIRAAGVALCLLACAIGISACGSRGSAALATTPDGRTLPFEPQDVEPNKGTPGVQDYSGGKIDVPIRDGRFTPHVMRLNVGQIVVFTNEDDELHAVWGDRRDQPHSGAIPIRGRYEFEPLNPGRVDYHDPLHPGMHGVLIVRSRERPKPCSEVSATARHELGDLKGDMVRDTRCTKRSPHR